VCPTDTLAWSILSVDQFSHSMYFVGREVCQREKAKSAKENSEQ